jgi:hypothetical protein
MLKTFDLDNYLFDVKTSEISAEEQLNITQQLQREIFEMFHGQNVLNV